MNQERWNNKCLNESEALFMFILFSFTEHFYGMQKRLIVFRTNVYLVNSIRISSRNHEAINNK